MISKELLREVLNINTSKYQNYTLTTRKNNIIVLDNGIVKIEPINIHELAHKCKEWAYAQSWIIFSGYYANSFSIIIEKNHSEALGAVEINFDFDSDTEPEAIFKACEWIRQNETNN